MPFSLSTSVSAYEPNTLLSASPPPSLFLPVLAFASVQTKTYSRAGTDATVLLRAAMHFGFYPSSASSVGAKATKNVTKYDLIEIRAIRRRELVHSIAMSSLPALLTISSFYRQSKPMLYFSVFDPAAITAESRCHDFGNSVPFCLLQSNNVATLCSTGCHQSAAVRTLNVPNVSSSRRDLALAALCFMRAAFLFARFLRRFFRENSLRLSLSSRCFLPRFLHSFF